MRTIFSLARVIVLFLLFWFSGAVFQDAALAHAPSSFLGESCPDGYGWQKVLNKTSSYLKIWVDGVPFSKEVYEIIPFHSLTRCLPQGTHTVKVLALTHWKIPLGSGVLVTIRGRSDFSHKSGPDPGVVEINESFLRPVPLLGADNLSNNFALLVLGAFYLLVIAGLIYTLFRMIR